MNLRSCSISWCLADGYGNGDQCCPMGPCGLGKDLVSVNSNITWNQYWYRSFPYQNTHLGLWSQKPRNKIGLENDSLTKPDRYPVFGLGHHWTNYSHKITQWWVHVYYTVPSGRNWHINSVAQFPSIHWLDRLPSVLRYCWLGIRKSIHTSSND